MKNVTFLLTTLLMASCTVSQKPLQLTQWSMQQEGAAEIYQVTAPTTVAGALHRAGVFGENPLEGLRLFEIDKTLFDSTWVFTTQFQGGKGHKILRVGGMGY